MTDETPDMVAVLHKQVVAEKALSRSLGEYRGKWVGVNEHEVVAAADSLDELLSIIQREHVEVESVFEVQEQGAACFF